MAETIHKSESRHSGFTHAGSSQQASSRVLEDNRADGQRHVPPQTDAVQPNRTGLPDNIKLGMESLSGYSMDDVRVHYNSSKPTQLNAHAYTQGADIHIASGQERHLPHEAWHVVQQKQGRVKPTMFTKDVAINDNQDLEREADLMGENLVSKKSHTRVHTLQKKSVMKGGKLNSIVANPAGRLCGNEVTCVVQRLTIDLDMDEGPDGGGRLGNVMIEGRAPTSSEGGQGDHTVSSSLINLGLKSQLYGQGLSSARENLSYAFDVLDRTVPIEGVEASRMNRASGDLDSGIMPLMMTGRKKETFSISSVKQEIKSESFDTLNPTEKARRLKDWVDKYIRLANQRDMSSFKKSEGRTDGGGQESEAQDRIIKIRNAIAVRERSQASQNENRGEYVNALLAMADIKPTAQQLPIFMHRLMAHGHLAVSAPNSSLRQVYEPRDPKVVKTMWDQIMYKQMVDVTLVDNDTWHEMAAAVEKFFGFNDGVLTGEFTRDPKQKTVSMTQINSNHESGSAMDHSDSSLEGSSAMDQSDSSHEGGSAMDQIDSSHEGGSAMSQSNSDDERGPAMSE